ncbi:MAG: monofunctional biosynthetic peptidoglycan transglycosylase [Myxococcaceae bacterium]|nr:monofunctional biosynthetic peptidoglycan transglycosylase [Myxococcaceae bacterium]
MSSRGPTKTQTLRRIRLTPAALRRWGRWLLVPWLLLVVWATVEYVRLPDVRPLLKENPRTTALMEQRAEEAREAGRKARQRQAWVPLNEVPLHVVAAILLSEDSRFFQHDGVDWVEVEDALEEAWERGELGRGASTLTQQLAKNLYLSTDRSLLRKAKEYILAGRLEDTLPKKRILTLYVNVVEWGEDIYGIEAAARAHFGVSTHRLSVAQGAMLAAMLPAPRRWLPARRPAVLRKRSGNIVERMERFRRISPAQAAAARAELARFFGGPGVVLEAPAKDEVSAAEEAALAEEEAAQAEVPAQKATPGAEESPAAKNSVEPNSAVPQDDGARSAMDDAHAAEEPAAEVAPPAAQPPAADGVPAAEDPAGTDAVSGDEGR